MIESYWEIIAAKLSDKNVNIDDKERSDLHSICSHFDNVKK